MNNRALKLSFYLLILFVISACGTAAAKKQNADKTQKEPSSTETQSKTKGNQFVEAVNTRIEENKIIDAVQASHDNSDELVILKSKVKYLEKMINETPGDTNTLFNNPYSLFNQQIIMDNGTIYYGSVVYQDENLVTVETLIGKLNLERNRVMRVVSHQISDNESPSFEEIDFDANIHLVEDGNTLYKSPAEIILLGNISTTFDDKNNTVLSGQVKNIGGNRADFVKLNMTLYRDWSAKLPPKTFTIFVDGSTMYFDQDSTKMSNSSIEPQATADFSLIIPSSFGTLMSWKYDIDFEEY